MARIQSFDLNTAMEHEPPTGEFQPLPAGVYQAQIIEDSIRETNTDKGQGEMLTATWQILEGDYAGLRVWQRITVAHSNDQPRIIGQRQLAEICVAVGLEHVPEDTAELHFLPCDIKVGIEPPRGQYKASNTIKAVAAYGTMSVQAAAPAQALNSRTGVPAQGVPPRAAAPASTGRVLTAPPGRVLPSPAQNPAPTAARAAPPSPPPALAGKRFPPQAA